MDANLKAKWIEALRSGQYPQMASALRGEMNDQPAFCCLGVLCDVMGASWQDGVPRLGGSRLDDHDEEILGRWTLETVGFDEKQQTVLFKMNDEEGKTFSEIADYIEANIPADPALIGNERT